MKPIRKAESASEQVCTALALAQMAGTPREWCYHLLLAAYKANLFCTADNWARSHVRQPLTPNV